MKKAILKNLMILSFAFAALFLVGNNVFAGVCDQDLDDPGDGGDWETHCDPVWTNENCKVGNIVHLHMRPKVN